MATKKENKKTTAKLDAKEQKQETKPVTLGVEARIDRLIHKEGSNLKAVASTNIGGFAVHGIKIMDSQKGLFVSMPSASYTDKDGNTKYSDIFHPTTAESREELNDKIKAAYEQALEKEQNEKQEEEAAEEESEEEIPQVGPAM